MDDAPIPPRINKPDEFTTYRQDVKAFKSEILNHIYGFDRLALLASTSLDDYRNLRDNAYCVEIANLYLKTIARG